jgi:hypothetical protein
MLNMKRQVLKRQAFPSQNFYHMLNIDSLGKHVPELSPGICIRPG